MHSIRPFSLSNHCRILFRRREISEIREYSDFHASVQKKKTPVKKLVLTRNDLFAKLNDLSKISNKDLSKVLNQISWRKYYLKEKDKTFLIRAYGQIGDWQKAIRYLDKPPVNLFHLNGAILACLKCQQYEIALSILNNMSKVYGILPDVRSYAHVLESFKYSGKLSDAIQLYNKMVDMNIVPNLHIYSTMITLCSNAKDFVSAFQYINEMKNIKKWDVVAYGSVLSCYFRSGKRELAEELLSTMKRVGVAPNLVIFNSLISSSRTVNESLSIFRDMIESSIEPDIITYNSIIGVCCRHEDCTQALAVLHSMVDEGFKPDSITYDGILCTLVNARRFSEVEKILDRMKVEKIHPTLNALNTLLEVYASLGKWQSSIEILESLPRYDLSPDYTTHLALVMSFVNAKQYNLALQYWNHAKTFQSMKHTSQLLENLLQVCASEGAWKEGGAIFSKIYSNCEDKDICMTMYLPYMQECVQYKNYVDMVVLYEVYSSLEIEPCVHADELVLEAYMGLKNWKAYLDLFHNLLKHPYKKLGAATYTSAIMVYEALGMWKEAIDVYDTLRLNHHDGIQSVYEATVRVVAKCGAFDEAMEYRNGDWYRKSRYDLGWKR